MIHPNKVGSNLLAVLATITAFYTIFNDWDTLMLKLFPKDNQLNSSSGSLFLIVSNALTAYLMYRLYYGERSRHYMTRKHLERSEFLLADRRKNEIIDVYTGIPNERKFHIDLKELDNSQYQLILLDLDKFGEINKKYGHDKGDAIMKMIAQSLYRSMRRDEEIYKREQLLEKSFVKRIYRKYNKGDEFIFLIKGEQFEAVGFLNRVEKEFGNFSRKSEEILGRNVKLTFHAAISPIFPNEPYDIYNRRLHECFVLAAEEKDNRRVYWFLDEYERIPEDHFKKRIYNEAHRLFSI